MKRLLLFFLLTAAVESRAQNWNPLPQVGVKRYFANEVGYLRGMRVDSIRVIGGDSVWYPFRSLRGPVTQSLPQFSNSGGASWLGGIVRKKVDGVWLFDTWKGDTAVIKTFAAVGNTWRFYDDTAARWYLATVSSVDTQSVLGAVDSIKTITLTAMSGSLPLPSDSLNGWTVVLSKEHGFIKVPDLYILPYPQNGTATTQDDYWFGRITCGDSLFRFTSLGQYGDASQLRAFGSYAGVRRARFSLINYQPPTRAHLYNNWQAGDVACYKSAYYVTSANHGLRSFVDTVVARTLSLATDTLSIKRWMWYTMPPISGPVSSNPKIALDSVSLINPAYMPEESPGNYILQYRPADLNYGLLSSAWIVIGGLPAGSTGITGYGYYSGWNILKAGVGHVYFYSPCGEAPCNGHEMLAYRIGNTTYGTLFNAPLSIRNAAGESPIISVSPVPASTHLRIEHSATALTFRITNIAGQVVRAANTKPTSIVTQLDVADLHAGIYTLTTTAHDGSRHTQKILIAR